MAAWANPGGKASMQPDRVPLGAPRSPADATAAVSTMTAVSTSKSISAFDSFESWGGVSGGELDAEREKAAARAEPVHAEQVSEERHRREQEQETGPQPRPGLMALEVQRRSGAGEPLGGGGGPGAKLGEAPQYLGDRVL
jgi:hypothetical protein